jgi:hypothetical protein
MVHNKAGEMLFINDDPDKGLSIKSLMARKGMPESQYVPSVVDTPQSFEYACEATIILARDHRGNLHVLKDRYGNSCMCIRCLKHH